MVFEILFLVLIEKKTNLKWILEDGHFVNDEKQLGKAYYTMIKKYIDSIKKGRYVCLGEGNYRRISIRQSILFIGEYAE